MTCNIDNLINELIDLKAQIVVEKEEASNPVRRIVKEFGLIYLMEEVTKELVRFGEKHKLRKNFVSLAMRVVESVTEELYAFEAKYGYKAGKEA